MCEQKETASTLNGIIGGRPVLPQYCRDSRSGGNCHPLYPQHHQSVAADEVPDLPHRLEDSQRCSGDPKRPPQVAELWPQGHWCRLAFPVNRKQGNIAKANNIAFWNKVLACLPNWFDNLVSDVPLAPVIVKWRLEFPGTKLLTPSLHPSDSRSSAL